MVAHSFNDSTQVAEAAGFLRIHGKPHLQRVFQIIQHHTVSETLTQAKQRQRGENKQPFTNAGVRVAKVDY